MNWRNSMKIAIASDHAGVDLKKYLKEQMEKKGIDVTDVGPYDKDSVDYPDYAQKMCGLVTSKEADLGIAICGTGVGMSIACNKVPGIRASLCSEAFSAKMTRLHNDSNVLCLGARVTGEEFALDILEAYLEHDFSGEERHQRRIDKLEGGLDE